MQTLTSTEAFGKAEALSQLGRYAEAELILHEAISQDRTNSELWNARGVMFANMGRHLDSVWCYRDGLTCNPHAPGIWTNLGNALTHLRQLKSAIVCHQRAIDLSKPDGLLFHNLGISLAEDNRHAEAVVAFTRALEADPNYHSARWDRARSYLYLGNYREGWADYEVRLITGQLPKRDIPGRPWDGTPYGGKKLLLIVEQGFGDTLWIARYLPRVKALGGQLFIECQKELIPLVARMGISAELIVAGETLPDADLHCHTCSLPGLFSLELTKVSGEPYISAPRDRTGKFQSCFAAAQGRLKVGVVWSGSVTFKKNQSRAQGLIRFLQAFLIPGVQLYSLQKGPPERELNALPQGNPVIDLAPLINDFADTAAAVAELDLIIMTDSAVAHLAGAIGKPVWLLLGHVPHWLWLLERMDSPWYASVRLFRPRAPNDWDFVFDSAAAELSRLVNL